MADGNTDEAIRPEEHQRIRQERDDLRKQVAELGGVVKDFSTVTKAYEHFKGTDGVTDPYQLALAAARDVTLKDVEPEQFGGKLDAWRQDLASMFATPGSNPPPADETPPTPVADTAPAPAFARPNPAADGTPPGTNSQMIATDSKEFKELQRTGNKAEIERLDKEGRIAWKSQAPAG